MGPHNDDRAGGSVSPGVRFHETFLSRYPRSQWPSYIDEIAVDISDKIGIGDTGLHQYNFPEEVGPLYREGMIATSGEMGDVERVLDETVSESELGTIVFQLNRLSYEIAKNETGLDDVNHALEAVFEKILTQKTGIDLSTQQQEHAGSISDVVMELFSRGSVAEQAEVIIEEFEASLGRGLLAKLDEPQMMTPLWTHQLEALRAWKEAGFRGYADMATATGKTVLGLAAIALRYGRLHPTHSLQAPRREFPNDRILIVAHSDLILEQWRREFDRHLNIPKERTEGSDEISLTWGEIHFRTPQRLINQTHHAYDLVILDEAHHYATARQWGELLEEFEHDIIALSGSIDDAGKDSGAIQERLRSKVGPELKRYGITDAQEDGVIPAFDWEIRYAPFETDDEFVELSQSIGASYEAFQDRVAAGEFEAKRRLHTFGDIRTLSQTSEGRERKQSDRQFRELATGLFSRQAKRWHLSPALDALTEVVTEHSNDHVIVLVDSNSQVDAVAERIRSRLPRMTVNPVTSDLDRGSLTDRIAEFNDDETGGVLIGTGDLLGEGVDIPNANVAVNMATGGVNPQLVQRIGRILRNPTGNKHAHFYNVVGIPGPHAALPAHDGRRLIEDAAKFFALGSRFGNLPGFALASETDRKAFGEFLTNGAEDIREMIADGVYEWPRDAAEREHLEALLDTLEDTGDVEPEEVLGTWSEYSWYESSKDDDSELIDERQRTNTVEFVIRDQSGQPVSPATISIGEGIDRDIPIIEQDRGVWTAELPPYIEMVPLEIDHPGYQRWQDEVATNAPSGRVDIMLEAVHLPDGFDIAASSEDLNGEVAIDVTTADGTAVEGASVSVVGEEVVEFTRSDAAGRAVVRGGSADHPVRIAVRHQDLGVRTGEVHVEPGTVLRVTLPE